MMKKIGSYTLRGKIVAQDVSGSPELIRLFDGRFDTAYVITKFVVAPNDMATTAVDVMRGKLMTVDTGNAKFWNWSDNEEIAWATITYDGNGSATPSEFNQIDPDNLVVEDLFVYFDSNSDLTGNYLIEMDKYDITSARGALALVRNNSQSV
jgi:hypothetical protein